MRETTKPKPSMIQGSILGALLAFSIPLLLGNILQQFYTTVDGIVVGRFVSDDALGAVNNSGIVVFLMVSFFVGIASGATVVISQYFGAKDTERLQRSVDNLVILSFVFAVFISVLGFVLTPWLLRILNTPPELLPLAQEYLRWIFGGMITSIFYNTISGILRGLGDSKNPLLFLVIATLINIVLDLVFVLVFHMGVAGAAIATVIAQGFSALFGIVLINRKHARGEMPIAIRLKRAHFDRAILSKLVQMGLPTGVQQTVLALGGTLVLGLVNTFGSTVSTGYSVAIRLDSFATLPMMTFMIAITTFVGQNTGARQPERVNASIKVGVGIMVLSSIALGGLLVLLGPLLMRLFTDSQTVIDAGMRVLYRIAPFYWLLSLVFLFSAVMRGSGAVLVPMFSSLLSLIVVRVPLSYLLAASLGDAGIWWAMPISWVVGFLFSFYFYRKGDWRNKGIVKQDELIRTE